jgi:hypothetical protein
MSAFDTLVFVATMFNTFVFSAVVIVGVGYCCMIPITYIRRKNQQFELLVESVHHITTAIYNQPTHYPQTITEEPEPRSEPWLLKTLVTILTPLTIPFFMNVFYYIKGNLMTQNNSGLSKILDDLMKDAFKPHSDSDDGDIFRIPTNIKFKREDKPMKATTKPQPPIIPAVPVGPVGPVGPVESSGSKGPACPVDPVGLTGPSEREVEKDEIVDK